MPRYCQLWTLPEGPGRYRRDNCDWHPKVSAVMVSVSADKDGRIGPVKSRAGRRTIFIPQWLAK